LDFLRSHQICIENKQLWQTLVCRGTKSLRKGLCKTLRGAGNGTPNFCLPQYGFAIYYCGKKVIKNAMPGLRNEEILMFYKGDSRGYKEVLKGIERKTLVHGERTLFTEFRLKKGSNLPSHSHPHEQTGYLVSGKMRLTIGEETYDVHPGDSWCIPGEASHRAQIIEDSIAIEVFSPVREDYLPE
jgi:quercetin dioxygenase-like cupin family protein